MRVSRFAGYGFATLAACLSVAACSSSDSGAGSGSGGATGSSGSGGAAVPGPGSGGSGGVGTTGTGGSAATGTGGRTGTGGTSSGSGGSASTGTGGSIVVTGTGGAGGSGTTSGCPGVPLQPDAMGYISLTSNPISMRGSWFSYSDCVDLKGVNCAVVSTPTAVSSFPNVGGKMCTSGHTSMAPGAWGAGIGLELNDGPPQMPYDTVEHGIKGFCFQLSGPTIPSSSIRVAFPTKNNPDNAYFSAVTTTGQHTVLFSDTAQGSWVTTKSAFEPTMVMLMQLQIPSTTTAPVPWDFCIEGLTAIMQ